MITITQFTLPQLRAAHDILTRASKAQAAAPKPQADVPAGEASSDASQDTPPEAKAEDVASASEVSTDSPPAEAKDATSAKAAPAGPSAETLAELSEKLPLAENKVQYIVGALQVAGARVQKLRQVRVVQLEGAPANAVKREEAAYLLDLLPEANRGQSRGDSRDGDRRGGKGRDGKGRGGRDGKKPGDKRGFGGPGAPGGKGPGAGGDRPQAGRGPGRPGGAQTKRG